MNGNRAVIYARYSSTGQTEQSIEGQLRDCYKLAEEMGLTVVKEYIDRALTGKNDNRPQFRKMINDSAFGGFDVVITWKMDRFARNRTDSALYKKILKDNGVQRVIYAAENIPEGNEGVILESVLEGMAEYFSLDLAQKTTRGKKESVRKGKHVGGRVLYGYKITTEKYYEVNETVAPVIRKIFNDYVSGVRAVDIAKKLNEAGIKTKVGDNWDRSKIGQLLRNKKYAGIYENYGVQSESPIPPIIDLETFEEAQKILAKNKKLGGRNKSRYRYLLSGKVKCGQCGSAMCGNYAGISKKNKSVRCYYTCNSKKEKKGCTSSAAHRDKLEALVIENTMNIILQDDFIEKIAQQIIELNSLDDETADLIKVYQAELEEIKTKINNLMNAIEEGIATKRMTDRMLELEKRENQLEEQIVFENAIIRQNNLTKEQIIYWLSMFKGGDIQSDEFIEKLIKLFIKKVVVNPNTIEIHYNYIKDNSSNKTVLVNFTPKTRDIGRIMSLKLSQSKTIFIGKNMLYLEVYK